jgi:class 3 adenylate cyclase/predicted ATPase
MKRRSRAGGKPAKARSTRSLAPKGDVASAAHRSSATQEIAAWLEALSLGQYAPRFAKNDITFAVLNDLTDQDLKELGVASLGHRRQLLRAIAERQGVEEGPSKSSPSVAPSVTEQVTAERRQVTVMFSDLVGSTALSARMDPEDLREVISSYQKCVAETVQRFGGFVAKYMGDGILIYFGYPQAHEDDAERAVRAGLELIQAVGGLKSNSPLQTRVGIATGLVVIGDLVGSGEAQERGIVGATPNLAARLQGIAEPNTVVIAENTRKLLGNLFDLQDLGAQELKGIASPVITWVVLRSSTVESRFEALHASGLTELVGREEELELLLRRWSKAKTGEGQVVLLSGEAGIGKSRLTAALLERLASEPHTRLRYFCSPQHTDSAFHPIISQMERAAGFAHDDTVQAKLDKLDAVLAQTSTSKQDAALFAEMLSLPNEGRYPTLDLAPELRRQRTLEALISQTEALSRHNPVLMILEDAHWIDPTSLEGFGRIIDRARSIRLLLIVTFRAEFQAPWTGRHYVTPLTVNRLGERDIGAMIDRVVGNKLLPANIKQDIIERTDGIPLFVEEITKAVLEAGSEEAAQWTAATIPSPALAVPPSLQASLMARLDRLGSAKEVAQIGAAIGREFSHTLLSAVMSKPEPELALALDRLIAAGLLFRHGMPPQASYLFKHTLVQDAAYGTLLREPRRALHARIAEILETKFGETVRSQPELLARHCTEAGLIEKAALFWGKAGQQSLSRSAYLEAEEQLRRALAQIATLPASSTHRREKIKLQIALMPPLMHTKGATSPEAKSAIERARSLIEEAEASGEPPGDPLLLFTALNALWLSHHIASAHDVARGLAEQMLALAEKQRSNAPLLLAHCNIGICFLFTGDPAKAVELFDRALALYNPAEDRLFTRRSVQDSRLSALTYRSLALWCLGNPANALIGAERALKDAREVGYAAPLMFVLSISWWIFLNCEDHSRAKARASAALDEAARLAEEKSASYWRALLTISQGSLLALTGEAVPAIQMLTTGLKEFQAAGATFTVNMYLAHLGSAYAQLGNFGDAGRCIENAIALVKTTGEEVYEAEVNRIAGEIALKSPKHDMAKAETHFQSALAVARQQQAKSWELRAATSMSRLWRDQGKRDQARELLTPVYGWFTEGFDTRDLKEAKALLAELEA